MSELRAAYTAPDGANLELWKKCLYYLVRADHPKGLPEKDVYFDHALAHIRQSGFENLPPLCYVELHALIAAAERRGRLAELDEAVALPLPL